MFVVGSKRGGQRDKVNETRSTRQGQRDKIDDDEHEDDDRSPDGFVELSNQAEPGAEMRVSCAES